ncbi:hypothetical protein [Mycolicibacterium moriokaense]|uniref:Uncharacterized protein n=1 Tax=Mycolicibacterium moriokaense TaxID=39691 RepID=A0A318HJC0_9MYCO|nr:hypothetical protein [Mycolicibacterium moriokaense]PXX10298.1 hypothetical protein C8E89_10494 [Mycolicibacterium moriokaense]
MTVDTAVEATEQLAQRDTIQAFRAGRYILIVAKGDLPTPGYEVDIEPNLLQIFPQQYNLVRRSRPGIWPQVVTPYTVAEVFAYPEDQAVVTVHHADGQDQVRIEESGLHLAHFTDVVSVSGFAASNEATGMSSRLRFDEAFAHAVANLPPSEPSHPDELTSVKVIETGALFGGFAGFHHLYVKVQSTTT